VICPFGGRGTRRNPLLSVRKKRVQKEKNKEEGDERGRWNLEIKG